MMSFFPVRCLLYASYVHEFGEMAEWFKAAVLKTVERKLRGFESLSLRQIRKELKTGNCKFQIFNLKVAMQQRTKRERGPSG